MGKTGVFKVVLYLSLVFPVLIGITSVTDTPHAIRATDPYEAQFAMIRTACSVLLGVRVLTVTPFGPIPE